MNKRISNILIQQSYKVYRRYFKQTSLGRLMAQQVLKRGWLSRSDLQLTQLVEEKASTKIEGYSKYTQEVKSTELPNFHLSPPLNLEVSDDLESLSYINVLLPSLQVKHMSGGPNTALFFAALLAEKGEYIRLIACDASAEGKEASLFLHMDSLLKHPVLREKIELVDAFDRSKPVYIGRNDIFFATAWWTAQIAKYGTEKTICKSFIYLIQDFELILHEGSTFQARALETYGLPHIPLINTNLLLEHLIQEKAGCYADQTFASKAIAFEPALDRTYYYPSSDRIGQSGKKVLLFYARPTVARRNLFEIGVVALRQAVASGAIDCDQWEVWAMGEKLPPIDLGKGVYLNPLPWLSFEDYAKRVRTADLLLSLMLSPHPSYPPLEMAASGKLVVTNSFSVKTSQRMHEFSPNILVAEPTPQSIAAALERAVGRINAGLPSYDPSGAITLPTDWTESLGSIIPELIQRIESLRSALPSKDTSLLFTGYPANPKTSYEIYRRNRLAQRRQAKAYEQKPGLLSFITSAYNTPSKFLAALGRSLFLQDGGMNFEWLILDNGSTDEETRRGLESLARYPNVRLERVEDNLGIIGGMRYLLERARGQYVLPLDSDDLVEPDCVNVLTHYICDNNYPPLLYTDEDKLTDNHFISPYLKSDWDPVLFLHSCYIAHLCAIDREKALALDLYIDKTAEGCHDWDSFIRFMGAGYTPHHIPEVLYSWRIHSGSTSGNISSKDYITNSHQKTLKRALEYRQAHNIELLPSPLFNHNVDWWFRRKRGNSVSCKTILLKSSDDITSLVQKVKNLNCDFIHLRWDKVFPDDDEWRWDAAALVELFPDTVMVGGTLHNGKTVVGGPCVFGFGNGYDCPDVGRPLSDPGYFAWMYKARSVSAVSTSHCVITLAFFMEALPILIKEEVPLTLLGPWLGALASETGRRVVFSPFMRAKSDWVPENHASKTDRASFLSRFWHLIPDNRFYSEKLGLAQETAYTSVSEFTRHQHTQRIQSTTLPYSQWLKQHIGQRLKKYPLLADPVSISLITTIYEGTDVKLLNLLAESILAQILKADEWIIVAHGPLSKEDLSYVQKMSSESWNATLIVEPEPLGIIRAMRVGLESANSNYIIPVDADDIITCDALHILTHYIEKLDKPDFLYSDEDLLIDEEPSQPYLRSGFDPILNLESSYVWHMCAIKRESALAFDLYKDEGATWCHDWDSITKVSNSGGKIKHVPEILYHWRQHIGSTTNNLCGDPRSLESVRHVLNRQIARTSNPELYYISDWPIDRGARELYIARRMESLPTFIGAGDVINAEACREDRETIVVFTEKGITVESQQVYLEVARLFELHAHLGAIGGLTVGKTNVIVDACYVANNYGEVENPWIGRDINYSGPYALALKPQTIAATGSTLAFFRVSALKGVGNWPMESDALPLTTTILCKRILENGWGIGFSPLIRAHANSTLQNEPNSTAIFSDISITSQILARYGLTRSFST